MAVGSGEYLSGILQSVREAYPNVMDTPILNTVFPALFLALVARDTNIILSTSHPVDLQKSTAKIVSSVFGLQSKRVKIRTPQCPRELLESLFVSASPGSSSSSSHKRKPSRNSLPRSVSAPRPPSSHFTEGSDSTAPPSAPRLPHFKTDPLPRSFDLQASYLPQVVILSGLERAGRAAQLALAEAIRTRRVALESAMFNLPDGFFIIYISPVGNGRERPNIHTALLDHFAFSITLPQNIPPVPASSSPRLRSLPLSSPIRKPPLLPYDRLPHPETLHVAPLISQYTAALLTAVRHHPELDGMFLTARCVKDAERLVRASGLVFREDEKDMTITEAHVRDVVLPVIAHRLRVRDSPREQIMGILWEGASVRNWERPVEEALDERRTIKEILAEILAEV